jgi:hypothetical protein
MILSSSATHMVVTVQRFPRKSRQEAQLKRSLFPMLPAWTPATV